MLQLSILNYIFGWRMIHKILFMHSEIIAKDNTVQFDHLVRVCINLLLQYEKFIMNLKFITALVRYRNPTMRTRIVREYGQIREYRVLWNATCPPRVRNRFFPDSVFFRSRENPFSGNLTETRFVKARKLSYSSWFATNNGAPQASTNHQV